MTVLRSHGYDVLTVGAGYVQGTSDERLLELATGERRVLLTNDQDSVVLARERLHTGVILFEQGTPAGTLARGIDRIDRYLPANERENTLVWLAQWLE